MNYERRTKNYGFWFLNFLGQQTTDFGNAVSRRDVVILSGVQTAIAFLRGRSGEGYIKQKTPSEIAEGSVMGWRRPTFPQIDAVSSALRGLTSLFGMGRGGPPRYSHHVFLYMS